MDLDPRYLQAFVEVGRTGSFSRAAATLHKTQPAVSYQIRMLEQQLGASLVDRTTRRPTLTPAGARLYELCDRFFGDFGRLAASLRDPAAVAQLAPLRIESVSGFGRYVLFPHLAAMPAPQAYSLRFPTAEQIIAALRAGTCDLGFVYLPLASSRLVTTAVSREELVLIAPPRARLPRTVEAFATLPFATYDEYEYVFGRWFEVVFGTQPRAVDARYHFEELEEVVATVAAGRAWSIVPDHCVGDRVAVLRHARRRAWNTIYAVQRASAAPHPAAVALLATVGARQQGTTGHRRRR